MYRCDRRMKEATRPELSLYQGLGAAAADEIQRLVSGEGPWLVVAVDPELLPRYDAMVKAFKSRAHGVTLCHFLSEDQSLNFQTDGLNGSQVQKILSAQSAVRGLVLLGGGLLPGGPLRDPAAPLIVAGPMARAAAQSALASGQLAAAIVYLESSRYSPDASPTAQFNASFEILHAPGAPQ